MAHSQSAAHLINPRFSSKSEKINFDQENLIYQQNLELLRTPKFIRSPRNNAVTIDLDYLCSSSNTSPIVFLKNMKVSASSQFSNIIEENYDKYEDCHRVVSTPTQSTQLKSDDYFISVESTNFQVSTKEASSQVQSFIIKLYLALLRMLHSIINFKRVSDY